MIGISDSVMSLGYKTSMAFNTSVNQKKTVRVINADRSLYNKKLGHGFPKEQNSLNQRILSRCLKHDAAYGIACQA